MLHRLLIEPTPLTQQEHSMNPMNRLVRTGNSLTIRNWLIAAVLGGCAVGMVSAAMAGGSRATEKRYFLRSKGKSWHSTWYDPSVGRPMALVVPPTAEFISEYSWGVPSSRTMPLYQQFYRPYPGPGAVPGQSGLLPTPNQPSDTVQFGVHSVRGPW